MSTNIPEAAVEAGARVICENSVPCQDAHDESREVLTAALPHLHPVIETEEQLDALPAGVVVHSADGTIACRHYSGVGVVFGDERPFDWSALELPATVLHMGGNDA